MLMRGKPLAVVAAMTTLFCGVASAPAIVIRHDIADADALALAADTPAVGKLLAGSRLESTATLIHPRWALTAAHSLTDLKRVNLEFAGQFVAGRDWYVHRRWNDNERQGFDIGLVRLASPITAVTPATLYTGRDERGKVGRLVGYGDHGDGLSGAVDFDQLKRAGENRIDDYERVRHRRRLVLVTDFDRPTAGDALPFEATTASGDSGGPLFIDGRLAGITSWGSRPFSEYGDVARYTRVSAFVRWIDKVIARKVRSRNLARIGRPGERIFDSRPLWRHHAFSTPATLPEPTTLWLAWPLAAAVLCRRQRS